MGFNSTFKGLIFYSLNKICHNSDVFRPILILFREFLNISKANDKLYVWNIILTLAHLLVLLCEVLHILSTCL